MGEAHERDYERRFKPSGPTRFLAGTNIEIIREAPRARPPEHALFDFDGTLSLIREGWPEVMVAMMVDELAACGTAESREALRELALKFIMQLNGKQTIYQMIRLAEEIEKRGGKPRAPLEYKNQYLDLISQHIRDRREALATGKIPPEAMLVPHALELLGALKARGIRLYLASGTDEKYVFEEAAALGLDRYFGACIYGAIDDYKAYSKQMVIERILRENRVEGAALIGFGDGYVEIDNVKAAGGTAVAVASDEAGRSGKPDAWKRDRLIGVGADVVIPDFRDWKPLVAYLWQEEPAHAL